MMAQERVARNFPGLVYPNTQDCCADRSGRKLILIRATDVLRYRLYQALWSGLDWIFPPICGGCETVGDRWCADCQAAVQPISNPGCPICGAPTNGSSVCSACGRTLPYFSKLRSVGVFQGPIKNALHRLKYKKDIGLGEALSRSLANLYASMGWEADFIVPIPLSKTRKAARGYNQVALLARPMAMQMAVPYRPDALSRIVDTRSQVGLSAQDRRKNLKNAFAADPRVVAGRRLLLVDDVFTTGSTLNAGAEALKKAGAREVFGLTLARAVLR